MTVPRARITEAELAAALQAVRQAPIRLIGGVASGHYETDHAAHARAVMDAVGAARRGRRTRTRSDQAAA